jgi:hypothetical protein
MNTDIDERAWADVVGADLLTNVVDLGGGITRVDDVRRCDDPDVVVVDVHLRTRPLNRFHPLQYPPSLHPFFPKSGQ